MKNRKGIFSLLLRVANAGSWLCLLVLLLSIASDVFTDDGTIGSVEIGNHHSKGYAIPVKVNINYADSVLVYGKGDLKQGAYGGNFSYYGRNNEIMDSLRQEALLGGCKLESKTYNKIRTYPFYQKENKANWTYHSFTNLDGYLLANTTDWMLKALLVIYSYLPMLFLVFIFYLLSELFNHLREKLSFTKHVYATVNRTGILIIAFVVFRFLASIVLGMSSQNILFESVTDGIPTDMPIRLSINPRIVFNFTLFIVGLSLWGFGALFKKGASMESENNLTI